MCFRNLFRRKFRTALCITGIALATMFIVAVGATTIRYATIIREMNVLFSGQVLVVAKGTILIQAIPVGGGNLAEKTASDIQQKLSNLTQKAVPILFQTEISMTENETLLQLMPGNFTIGIPVKDWQVLLGPTQLRTGGYWPTNESGNEIVTGASLADQRNWVVGSKITIKNYEAKIAGILDTNFAIFSRSVIMPLKLTQKIYTLPMQVNMIAVTPLANCSEGDLKKGIEENILDVRALTEDERNDMVQPILAQVEMWNIGIQTVVFLLSLILVLTVTTMNVSERRRDFATLDAIGAPLSSVFRIVIIETTLIGLIGGIIGLAFGSLAALTLASLYTNIPLPQFFPSLFDIVPPLFMVEIFASTIIVCCIGGIIPAINATKTRISEVLRAEY
jgi:putative ABC transport system permease protein